MHVHYKSISTTCTCTCTCMPSLSIDPYQNKQIFECVHILRNKSIELKFLSSIDPQLYKINTINNNNYYYDRQTILGNNYNSIL